jgi:hypothetical protein
LLEQRRSELVGVDDEVVAPMLAKQLVEHGALPSTGWPGEYDCSLLLAQQFERYRSVDDTLPSDICRVPLDDFRRLDLKHLKHAKNGRESGVCTPRSGRHSTFKGCVGVHGDAGSMRDFFL